jgi:hypothetical protein
MTTRKSTRAATGFSIRADSLKFIWDSSPSSTVVARVKDSVGGAPDRRCDLMP